MNNNRSPVEQTIRFALLMLCAFFLFKQFYGTQDKGGNTPPKPPPALAKAFEGIGSEQGTPLGKDKALSEVKTLKASIENNNSDEHSYWARLRLGLIQQYVLKDPTEAAKYYGEVINRHTNEQVDAQALYQKGDMQ